MSSSSKPTQVGLKLSEKSLSPAERENRSSYINGQYVGNSSFVGEALPASSEQAIYKHLGLVYVPPADRDGKIAHTPMQDWDTAFCLRWLEHAAQLPKVKVLCSALPPPPPPPPNPTSAPSLTRAFNSKARIVFGPLLRFMFYFVHFAAQ
eukprot:SAG11_NODE_12656_length_692_cov_1.121417_1_plen_150_part_00